ncbi:unnamed protein product [Camellia sinensis]
MEGLAEDGIEMFFCFHVSKRMAGYGKVFTDFVIGMGNFVSAITIYASRRWFRDTLNNSRLDKYYQMLAILSYVNLCKVRKRNIINCENGVPWDDIGLGLLTMSTPPVLAKATATCSLYKPECIGEGEKILFYTALALVAIGVSGHLILLSTFMVEQLTEVVRDNLTMRSCLSLFLGTYATILIPIGGIIAISFIKIWSLRFGIPVICSVVATLIFLSGSGSYNCVKPQGSSLTTVFRVLVAATSKMFHKWPEEADQLYEMVLIFIWSLILVA